MAASASAACSPRRRAQPGRDASRAAVSVDDPFPNGGRRSSAAPLCAPRAVGRAVSGPPADAPHKDYEGRDEKLANEERVQEKPEGHRKGGSAEVRQRHDGKQRERACQDQAGRGDGSCRPGTRRLHRLPKRSFLGLFSHASGEEHVVVGAEREKEDRHRERHKERDRVRAEERLVQVSAEPEGGEERQDAGGDQVERGHERAQGHERLAHEEGGTGSGSAGRGCVPTGKRRPACRAARSICRVGSAHGGRGAWGFERSGRPAALRQRDHSNRRRAAT